MKVKPDGISFVVPAIPPSVNHYILHTRRGRHYKSAEAIKFKADVALCARGKQIRWKRYGVEIALFLGRKQKGDLDNFAKCVLDGLKDAAVIDSDAKIVELTMRKDRDLLNPRTIISVWAA